MECIQAARDRGRPRKSIKKNLEITECNRKHGFLVEHYGLV